MTRDLEPAAGVLNGLRYPIAADLEGLSSPLLKPLVQRIAGMPMDQQLHWLRALGVEAVVVEATRRLPLPELAGQASPDGDVLLQAVVDPMPDLLWPIDFETARSVSDAYRRVTLSADPVARPVLLEAVDQGALRRLERVAQQPDRLVFEVDSDGGVVVLRRAFHPLYRAHATGADGRRVQLPRLLANAFLLAVRVPPGRQRVVIDISSAPEWAGVAASFVTLVLLLGWILWLQTHRVPARRTSV